MSFVNTHPELLSAAAADLQVIGSALGAGNVVAAAPTTGVLPPAADEISALVAAQFATQAQMYQQIAAQATAIHQQLVDTLAANAEGYATTEALNAAAAG